MKHRGSTFDLEQQRNDDLYRAYREQMKRALTLQGFIAMPEVWQRTANSAPSRFWVSPGRATIVIASMLNGKSIASMRQPRQEMYREILKRVIELRKQHPHLPLHKIVHKAVLQPAPKFYLTPLSTKVIICNIKKGWYAQRRTSQSK